MCNYDCPRINFERQEHRFPVSEDISLVGFAELDNEIDSITCTLDNTSGFFPANEVPSKYVRPVVSFIICIANQIAITISSSTVSKSCSFIWVTNV